MAVDSGAPAGATGMDTPRFQLALAGDLPAGTILFGDKLTWAVPAVPVGDSVAINYTVTVRDRANGVTMGTWPPACLDLRSRPA